MAAIFDMDGVLADTQSIHSRIESELLAGLGIVITPEEITRRFSGRSLADQFIELHRERNKPYEHDEALSDKKAKLFMERASEYKPIEGTIVRAKSLYGLTPLGVASASRPQIVDLVLTTIGVKSLFDAFASSREVAHGKPAPDVFLLCAERLGVDPQDCTVIEDGVSGMIGARKAGMRCIALDRSGGTEQFPADMVVRDLREVPKEYFLRF